MAKLELELGFFDSKFSAIPLTPASALGHWQIQKGERAEFMVSPGPLALVCHHLSPELRCLGFLRPWAEQAGSSCPPSPLPSKTTFQCNLPQASSPGLARLFLRVPLRFFSIKIPLQSPTSAGGLPSLFFSLLYLKPSLYQADCFLLHFSALGLWESPLDPRCDLPRTWKRPARPWGPLTSVRR